MSGRNSSKLTDERLDQLGRLLVRAAADAGDAADPVASSPFLYTRVRARIEERRREQAEEGWRALVAVAWRAVPAMAAVAAVALVLMMWVGLSGASASSLQSGDEAALVGARGTGPVAVVLSGNGQLSRDDVFELVVNREVSGTSR